MKKIVIALGGNAIKQWNQKGSTEEQLENLRRSCSYYIVKIIKRGFHVVITYGNVPQVGDLLIQKEEATGKVSPQPLYVCDAMTQGQKRSSSKKNPCKPFLRAKQ